INTQTKMKSLDLTITKRTKKSYTFSQRLWRLRFVIPPLLALIAIVWLVAYAYMFTWWKSIILVEPPKPIHLIHLNLVRADTRSMSDQEYACYVFGKDCKLAIAVLTAESHFYPYAINKNTDGSFDLGCAQLNDRAQKFDRSEVFNCKWSI